MHAWKLSIRFSSYEIVSVRAEERARDRESICHGTHLPNSSFSRFPSNPGDMY
jgi:hypothetical protein